MNNEVSIVSRFITEVFPTILPQLLTLLAASIYMITINWKLYSACVFLVPITMIVQNILTKRVNSYSKKYFNSLSEGNSIVYDILSRIRIVKAFNLEDALHGKCKNRFQNALEADLKLEKVRALSLPVTYIQLNFSCCSCSLFKKHIDTYRCEAYYIIYR